VRSLTVSSLRHLPGDVGRGASAYIVLHGARAAPAILVQYQKRQVGKQDVRRRRFLICPLKINPRASSRRFSPPRCGCVAGRRSRIFEANGPGLRLDRMRSTGLSRARPATLTWRSILGLICFFCFFYNRDRFQTDRGRLTICGNMAGFIPGIRSRKGIRPTYLDYVADPMDRCRRRLSSRRSVSVPRIP